MLRSKSRLFVICSICALLAVTAAHAGDFYKGKDFTIVVGFSPGGGYDTYARNVARYIGTHIPGNSVIFGALSRPDCPERWYGNDCLQSRACHPIHRPT